MSLEKKGELAEYLKNMRLALGYKQTQWCKILGVSQSMVSKIERGLTRPPIDKIARLAKFLGVTPGEIIDQKIIFSRLR